MEKEGYPITLAESNFYTFISTGKKGEILKGIYFQEMETPYYNLVLLDFDFETQKWSDITISNNGDVVRIMKTVINIIEHFFSQNPAIRLLIEGNTTSKKKLYNRIVKNNLDWLSKKFEISISGEKHLEPINFDSVQDLFYIWLK
jgi:hypothetical protein